MEAISHFGTADGAGCDAISSPVGKLGVVVAAQNVDVANDEVVGLRCAIWTAIQAQCGVDFLRGGGCGEKCRYTCGQGPCGDPDAAHLVGNHSADNFCASATCSRVIFFSIMALYFFALSLPWAAERFHHL